MKIYVLGSNSFIKEMVEYKNKLCVLGREGWIHPDYESHVRGEKQHVVEALHTGEHAEWKRQNDYIRQHYTHILQGVI